MNIASTIEPLRVVIAGGGVAALEALLALHDLGERRFRLVLVAPNDDFVLRPMAVAVPFSAGHQTRVPLRDVCARYGAEHRPAEVRSVDAEARVVRCDDGSELVYDALVLATGAAAAPAYARVLTFDDADPTAVNGLLRDIEQGYCPSLAVVVPPQASWALPAYELTLMLARAAAEAGIDGMPTHLVTPEAAPLAIFGPKASSAVGAMLHDAGVRVHTDAYASVSPDGPLVLTPGDVTLDVARIVALPVTAARPVEGIPADESGFVPIDGHCRVVGLNGVYAAGDGTDFPIKQGGLATQQADAAARHIAAEAGARVDAQEFRPVLRGMLLTAGGPRFLHNEISGGRGEGRISDASGGWPPVKVLGEYLSTWLAGEQGTAPKPARPTPGPAGAGAP